MGSGSCQTIWLVTAHENSPEAALYPSVGPPVARITARIAFLLFVLEAKVYSSEIA
jgi:hypothetical protein